MRKLFGNIFLGMFFSVSCLSQEMFEISGSDALIESLDESFIGINSNASNQKAYVQFGDNNLSKYSIGYQSLLRLSKAANLESSGFELNSSGSLGVNSSSNSSRFYIRHNSTSGTSGSAHLGIEENNNSDYSVLKFSNALNSGEWLMKSIVSNSTSNLRFQYIDNSNNVEIMNADGDNFRVGIHQNTPLANFHVRQLTAGVDAMAFEEPDSQGSDIWGFRIGSNDILIYINGSIRGGFDAETGNYNNFPPSAASVAANSLRKRKDNSTIDMLKLKMFDGNKLELDMANSLKNEEVMVDIEKHNLKGIRYDKLKLVVLEELIGQQKLIDTHENIINDKFERLAKLQSEIIKFEHAVSNIDQ